VAFGRETVGTAYVRILADGTGLPKSIRDEMDDLDPVFEDKGEEHSRAYTEGFNAQNKKDRNLEKGLRAKIDRAFGQIDADTQLLARGLEEKIQRGIVAGLDDDKLGGRAQRVGEKVAKNMSEGLSRTGVLPGNIRGQIDKALAEVMDADEFERKFRRNMAEIEVDARNAFDGASESIRDYGHHLRTVTHNIEEFSQKDHLKKWFRDIERGVTSGRNVLDRLGDSLDTAGNKVGKAFGRGSRNDLLNFFGAFVQAPVEILARVVRGIGGLADEGRRLKDVFGQAGGGFSGLGALSKELAPLAGNIFAVGGAIAGLILILGPVAGLISGIVGAIVALGSAVSFALSAGLGVLGGLLAPIAFGLATVGLAFIGLDDKMKKGLKESLKGTIDQFKELKTVAAGGIVAGITDSADDIEGSFKNITPLIKDVSDAIGDVIGQFAKASNSPGFRTFVRAMQQFIPDAIRTMGTVARNVFAGIGGLLRGLAPITMDFLGWLSGVTSEFAEWANSAGGQAGIVRFMSRAADSAQELWDLITTVGEAIGKVLFSDDAREGGNDLLQSMTESVQQFIDYLDTHPGAIKKWIGDGVRIAKEVGNAVRGILDIFNALDTPENRKLASQIFGGLASGLHGASVAIDRVNGAFGALKSVLPSIPFASTISDLVSIGRKGDDAWRALKSGAQGIVQPIRNALASIVGKFLDLVGVFVTGAAKAFGWMPKIGPRLRAAAADFEKFKNDVNRSLRGVTPTVKTDYSIVGSKAALDDIADLQWEWNQVPRSVTTSYIIKMSGHAPRSASGGVFVGPQTRLIGEDGPEAVVPLNRPLGLVDPAVRSLSAIAQGKAAFSETNTNNSRSINVGGLTIVTPAKDPAAVAREAVNRLAAASYF